jgi:hypothetical protein
MQSSTGCIIEVLLIFLNMWRLKEIPRYRTVPHHLPVHKDDDDVNYYWYFCELYY